MKRTPFRRSTTPLKPVSDRRARVNRIRKRNLVAAFGPRPWRCHVQDIYPHICFGEVNGHEIKSRARSGLDSNLTDPSGIIPACDYINGWIEDNPEQAHALGLTVHAWEGAG